MQKTGRVMEQFYCRTVLIDRVTVVKDMWREALHLHPKKARVVRNKRHALPLRSLARCPSSTGRQILPCGIFRAWLHRFL